MNIGTLWGYSLNELFSKGGVVMWPLLGSSILVLALTLDRALAHWRMRLNYPRFLQRLRRRIAEGAWQDAEAECERLANPIARAAAAYLLHRDADDALRAAVVQREGSTGLEAMERRLRGLAVLASLSTLTGLLGTVTGLVNCFQRIAAAGGQVQPGDLAAGIWEALLTTVFGLTIAIPATALYHYFDHRTDLVTRRMGFIVSYLDEWLGKVTPTVAPERPPSEAD